MKKGAVWTIILIMNVLFMVTFFKSIAYQMEIYDMADIENKTAVFFLPVFYWIVVAVKTLIVVIAGMLGLRYLKNTKLSIYDFFIHRNDLISLKILKVGAYFLMLILCVLMIAASGDWWGMLTCILNMLMTALYVIWFSTVLYMEHMRNDYR